MRILNSLRLLVTGESNDQNDGHTAETQSSPASDTYPYSQRLTDYYYVAPHEVQHRTAERYYWGEQLRLAKKLNRLTRKLNYITAWGIVATFLNLFFLWLTLDITIKNAWLDKRAWVGTKEFTATVLPNEKMLFEATLDNAGEAPAIKLKGTISAKVLNRGEKFSPSYNRDDATKLMDSVMILFPGGPATLDTNPGTVTELDRQKIRGGERVLYIYGMIEYSDPFTPSFWRPQEFHCTTFCVFMRPDFKNVGYCPTYNNTTDAKCEEVE